MTRKQRYEAAIAGIREAATNFGHDPRTPKQRRLDQRAAMMRAKRLLGPNSKSLPRELGGSSGRKKNIDTLSGLQ